MNHTHEFNLVTYFQKTEIKYSYDFNFCSIPFFVPPERYPELERVYQKYEHLRYMEEDSPIKNWLRYCITYYLTSTHPFDCDECDEILDIFRTLKWEIIEHDGSIAVDRIFSFHAFWSKATQQKATTLNDYYLSKLVNTPFGKKTIQEVYLSKAMRQLTECGSNPSFAKHLAHRLWQFDAFEKYRECIGAELFAQLERYAALTFSLGNFMPCPPGNYCRAKDAATNCLNDRFDFLLSFLKKYKAGRGSLGYTLKEKKYRVEEAEMAEWIEWFDSGLPDQPDLPRIRRYYLDSFFEGGFVDWETSELRLLPMAGTKLPDYLAIASKIMEDRGIKIATELKNVTNTILF